MVATIKVHAAHSALAAKAARKLRVGQFLLVTGGAALAVQLWALWLEAGAAWGGGAVGTLGWMGALGMAMLQVVNFVVWNPNGILLSLTRVLLLCWPMAVMVAGIVVARRPN